ncbi:helix-turn-helix domain-containing protein [Micromonospora sp. NPDC002389]|uniref:nSTAND1 domain-containing NTPase n=1 Tax=Micromonospora sp. NPDC002389 TaxID=3154272 RepID=UPI003316A323
MVPSDHDSCDSSDPTRISTRKDFAGELTSLRKRANLTIRKVAKAAGLPASTVGDYFSGSHLPPTNQPHILEGILRSCGVGDPAVIQSWTQALRRVWREPGPRARTTPTPYMGLSSFQPEHVDWFFGRERLTDLLVTSLGDGHRAGRHLIAVVGPSGSGKSSLLRAGLIPAIHGGRLSLADVERWATVLFTPGEKPLAELTERLAAVANADPVEVENSLRKGDGLETVLAAAAADPDSPAVPATREAPCPSVAGVASVTRSGLVFIVDQFEEVFAVCQDQDERRIFIAALYRLAEAGTAAMPVLIAVGMRADFYGHALRYEQLVPALQDSQVVVGPMSVEEIERAISEPAKRVKADIEDGLVALLLSELAPTTADAGAAHDAGTLPLLSHALLVTWERGQRGKMTVAGYRETGGISHAVAHTAEEVHEALSLHEQELARQLFLRLVQVAPDISDTRRRVPLSELQHLADSTQNDEVESVVDKFIDKRLLTADIEHVEIAHEALLTAWPRLRAWIDADRAGIRIHRQLTEAARVWQETARDVSSLHRGTRLAVTQDWVGEPGHNALLNTLEREFLDASVVYDATEQDAARRQTRRLYQLVASLVVLLLVAASLTGYAVQQGQTAAHERDLAVSRQIAITADQLRSKDVALAAQLSLAAYRIAPTMEARSSLLESYGMPTVTRLTTPGGYLQMVAVSSDGHLMATGGPDGYVYLWDLTVAPPSRIAQPLTGHNGPLYGLSFSPDGTTLATGGEDKTVRLWDVTVPDTAKSLAPPLTGAGGTIYSVSFSPDGRTLAVGGADKTIQLWDLTDRAAPIVLGTPMTGPMDAVQSVAFRSDGRVLVAGSADNTVRLWDISDRNQPVPVARPLTGPTGTVFSVVFSPDGRTVAAGSKDYNVWLWDTSDLHRPRTLGPPLTGASSWINSVAFSPDGATLAAGSSDAHVWFWQISTRQPIRKMPHPAPVTSLTFTSDGGALATAAADGTARLWRLTEPAISGPDKTIFTVMFGPRDRLIFASSDNTTAAWNVTDPRAPVSERSTIVGPADLARASGAAALSPDGHTAAIGSVDGTVQLWDVDQGGRSPTLRAVLTGPTALVQWLDFAPDGHTLAGGSDDHNVWLWDTDDTTKPGRALTGHSNYVYSVAFSPDGRTLASGSVDTTVRLWDVTSPQSPTLLGPPLAAAANYITSVDFSPDGRLLAAGSADNTVHLWDTTDRTHPRRLGSPLAGPHNYVRAVAFSPDSRTLAAAGGDGTLWFWDTTEPARPQVLAAINASTDPLYNVKFHPDRATVVASAGADKVVRLWEIDAERVAAEICATIGDLITPSEWSNYASNTPFEAPCPTRA